MSPEPEPEPEGGLAPAGLPAAFDVDEIRTLIEKHFKVYEVEDEIRGLPRGEIAAYYVQTEGGTFQDKFERLRTEVRQRFPKLVLIVQHRMGEDIILVARKPPVADRGPGLNIVLLILTIITTTLGGALFYQPYAGVSNLWRVGGLDLSFLHPSILFLGFLTFSLPLILILGVHELGHWYVARRHHVRTSLPYFIPVPPIVPIGTFGAFISIREPIPDRKALFDIGASGPIAGFLLAIPVIVLGIFLTATFAVPVPPLPDVHERLSSPGDGIVLGHNATAPGATIAYSFGNATFTSADSGDVGQRIRTERIFLQAAGNHTLPEGNWTLDLLGGHLDEETRAEVTITVHAANGTAPPTGFTVENGAFVLTYERALSAAAPDDAFGFDLPNASTNITAVMVWHIPPSGYVELGDSLFFAGLQLLVGVFIDVDDSALTHPTALAGWVGLLVTGFNLLPAGQLDGGHVARALFGERMRWASYLSVVLMVFLSFKFFGWIIMAILVVFLGLQHPPPLNDKSPLGTKRIVLGCFVILLLLVTFVPYPFVPV